MSIIDNKVGSPGQRVGWESRKYGVELAEVTNINDPEKLGRIKCKVLSEDKTIGETDWSFVMTPFGGKEYGAFFHPNVGDIVVMAYAGGDVHRPYILGSLWTKETAAPYKLEGEKNEVYALKTPGKTELKLTDTKDKQKVTLTMPSGSVLSFDDEKKKIDISDKEKKNSLSMLLDKGEITLKGEKKITLAAGETKITLDSQGNITVESKSKISLKTATFEVKANGKAEINSSGSATLKASGQLTCQSSGMTTVKGSMVKIN